MHIVSAQPTSTLRQLENWLPFAQSENNAQRWGYEPHALEQLVVQALPNLHHAQTLQQARFVLWWYHWHTSVSLKKEE